MKKILLLLVTFHLSFFTASAQYDLLSAKKNVIKGNYNFWVYTPEEYYYTQETTPLIFFLHGASLCGHDLNRVLRYGSIDAAKMGLMIPAGMSLGGYGTIDFAGTYPDKIAAAVALCGGATIKDYRGLGELPLWIVHGTADRAVSVKESQKIVTGMKTLGITSRLRFDWLPGASHGALARFFYTSKTYEWLFQHTLRDPWRPVNTSIDITKSDLSNAYREFQHRTDQLEKELDSER